MMFSSTLLPLLKHIELNIKVNIKKLFLTFV